MLLPPLHFYALRSEVQQGLSSGEGSYAEDVFQRLERKYANQAPEKSIQCY